MSETSTVGGAVLSSESSQLYVDLLNTILGSLTLLEALGDIEGSLPVEVKQTVLEVGSDWRVHEAMSQLNVFDPATYKHVARVGALASLLAWNDGYNRREVGLVAAGALMHDLGKTGVRLDIIHPPEVKNSKVDYTPGSSDRRFAAIQMHPEIGFHIARNLYRDEEDYVSKTTIPYLVLTHHCHNAARRNYPDEVNLARLEEEGTLLRSDLEDSFVKDLGGILALADVYEAITAKRTYTHGNGFENPQVVRDSMLESHPRMEARTDLLMSVHVDRFPPDGWM